jgi:septum formation protein
LTPIVLASTSAVRARLLANAGIAFDQVDPNLDESQMKNANRSLPGMALAERLAQAKAAAVSAIMPGRCIIGADQVLVCGEHVLDKPKSLAEARQQLVYLSAKTHQLETAVAAYRDARHHWSTRTTARLTMRSLSDGFLDRYLEAVGADALTSVGAYKLEGLGSQLFETIEGDYFSILGLPLLELMKFLREQGLLAS